VPCGGNLYAAVSCTGVTNVTRLTTATGRFLRFSTVTSCSCIFCICIWTLMHWWLPVVLTALCNYVELLWWLQKCRLDAVNSSSRFLGQLLPVDLITCVKCLSVRLSTKSFFDFNEIWCVGRGRWVMHDGIQYDLIQRQGHEPMKVGKSAIFKGYLLPHLYWGLANGHGFLN